MTRTAAIARYLEAFRTWNTFGAPGGSATLRDFNKQVAAGLDSNPAVDAWVVEAERLGDAGRSYAEQVGAAEAFIDVASSNFVCGYSATDAAIGARAYLAPARDDNPDAAFEAWADAREAGNDRPEWRD